MVALEMSLGPPACGVSRSYLFSYVLGIVTHVEFWLGRVSLAQYFHLPKRNDAEWLMGNPTAATLGSMIHYAVSNFLFILVSVEDVC